MSPRKHGASKRLGHINRPGMTILNISVSGRLNRLGSHIIMCRRRVYPFFVALIARAAANAVENAA